MTGHAAGPPIRNSEGAKSGPGVFAGPPIAVMTSSRLVTGLILALTVARCGPAPLDHLEPSAEHVARAVLAAVERHDVSRLHLLAISEREFQTRVWPGLPAARPGRNLPWSYVWTDLRQKSNANLKRTLSEHGGRRYELRTLRFLGESTKYADYRVHRSAVLLVRDISGAPHELRVLGSMIEADGGWKVFSYLADR